LLRTTIARLTRRWPRHAAAATLALTISVALGAFAAAFVRVASWSPPRLESRLLLQPLPPADWEAQWTTSAISAQAQQEAAFHHLGLVILVLSAVGVVIGLISFAALVLSAASARRNELATRAALGATPLTLIGLLLRHAMALSAVALGAGVTFASFAASIVERAWPHTLVVAGFGERLVHLFATGSLIVLTAVVVSTGLACLTVLRQPLAPVLTSGTRVTASPAELQLRDALTVLQFAGVLALLSGAVTLVRESRPELAASVSADSLLVARLQLMGDEFQDKSERVRFLELLRERVRALPGVEAESLASAGAWLGLGPRDRVIVECGDCYQAYMYMPTYGPIVRQYAIMPNFFDVLGLTAHAGRVFDDGDTARGDRVALVNRPLGITYFQRSEPLGRHAHPYQSLEPHRIVGAVPSVWTPVLGGSHRLEPAIYLPLLQYPPRTLDLLVRTRAAETVSASLQQLRAQLPAGVLLHDPKPADSILRELGASLRFLAELLVAMATLVILPGMYGVYALQRFRVENLQRELAIRLALGLPPRSLVRHVLARTARLIRFATLIGIFGALAAARGVQRIIPGAPPFALGVVASTTLLLVTVALLGSLLPARRAARLDPAALLD
jgi:ABC-type lipoprotein release transport system permease subunit